MASLYDSLGNLKSKKSLLRFAIQSMCKLLRTVVMMDYVNLLVRHCSSP